jgi:hypothetical protein
MSTEKGCCPLFWKAPRMLIIFVDKLLALLNISPSFIHFIYKGQKDD